MTELENKTQLKPKIILKQGSLVLKPHVTKTFNDFFDLCNSESSVDIGMYGVVKTIFFKIFGKCTGRLVFEDMYETEENKNLIKSSWGFIETNLKIAHKVSSSKYVKYSLRLLVESLNHTYNFKKPILYESIHRTYHSGTFSSSYYEMAITL